MPLYPCLGKVTKTVHGIQDVASLTTTGTKLAYSKPQAPITTKSTMLFAILTMLDLPANFM